MPSVADLGGEAVPVHDPPAVHPVAKLIAVAPGDQLAVGDAVDVEHLLPENADPGVRPAPAPGS